MQAVLAHSGGVPEGLMMFLLVGAVWVAWVGWTRTKGKGFSRIPMWLGRSMLGVSAIMLVASAVLPKVIYGGPPSSPARIAFVDPAPRTVARGSFLPVRVDVEDATIASVTASTPDPSTGWLVISVDGIRKARAYAEYSTLSLADIDDGTHVLSAEFIGVDGNSFSPKVVAQVTFTRQSS